MNIYKVYRTDEVSCGEQAGVVVIAADDKRARSIAAETAGYEGQDRWFDLTTVIDLLGVTTENRLSVEYLVCSDFRDA